MLFFDYWFDVAPGGKTIMFDDELTIESLGIKPGQTFIATTAENGKVLLKGFDISDVEHIHLESS